MVQAYVDGKWQNFPTAAKAKAAMAAKNPSVQNFQQPASAAANDLLFSKIAQLEDRVIRQGERLGKLEQDATEARAPTAVMKKAPEPKFEAQPA